MHTKLPDTVIEIIRRLEWPKSIVRMIDNLIPEMMLNTKPEDSRKSQFERISWRKGRHNEEGDMFLWVR
jgi:hypothetical protein